MSERTQTNLVNIALLAVGAYVVWKYVLPLVQSAAQGASAAGSAVSSGIASTITALTLPPPIVASTSGRGVNVPGMGVVPLASFTQLASSPDSTQLYGVYAGMDWTISGPLDANGNYTAS